MSITSIDKILAAYERTGLLGTVQEAKRVAATAQALGIAEALVLEALEREGVLC